MYLEHFRNSIKNFLRPITSLSTHRLFDVERGALEEGPHELVRVPGDGVGSSNEIFIDVSVLVPCRDIYCLLHLAIISDFQLPLARSRQLITNRGFIG